MDCTQLRSILDLYLDHEISGSSAALATSHLATCARCRYVAEQAAKLRNAIKESVKKHEPSPRLIEALRRRLFRSLRNESLKRQHCRVFDYAGMLASSTGLKYCSQIKELLIDDPYRKIALALAALEPECRVTVLLADAEELSYAEIAEVMESRSEAVTARLKDGRSMLTRLLNDHNHRPLSVNTLVRRK